MIFGAHLSTEGGLPTAFDRAAETGCDAFQVFTKNKGMWAAKPLAEDMVREFHARVKASRACCTCAHAAYLINLASPSKELRAKSTEALRIELERCETLGIPFLVVHPGSHSGAGEEKGLAWAAKALDQIHRATRGFRSRILLEIAAGQGASVCATFASLGGLISRAKEPERLGVCLDTCHALAAGYEIRTREGYEAAMAEMDRTLGPGRVLVIHANDSKTDLGSRVDRHEHIGRGKIGLGGFRWILKDPRFREVPFIFELPPEDGMIKKNLTALRKVAGKKA